MAGKYAIGLPDGKGFVTVLILNGFVPNLGNGLECGIFAIKNYPNGEVSVFRKPLLKDWQISLALPYMDEFVDFVEDFDLAVLDGANQISSDWGLKTLLDDSGYDGYNFLFTQRLVYSVYKYEKTNHKNLGGYVFGSIAKHYNISVRLTINNLNDLVLAQQGKLENHFWNNPEPQIFVNYQVMIEDFENNYDKTFELKQLLQNLCVDHRVDFGKVKSQKFSDKYSVSDNFVKMILTKKAISSKNFRYCDFLTKSPNLYIDGDRLYVDVVNWEYSFKTSTNKPKDYVSHTSEYILGLMCLQIYKSAGLIAKINTICILEKNNHDEICLFEFLLSNVSEQVQAIICKNIDL